MSKQKFNYTFTINLNGQLLMGVPQEIYNQLITKVVADIIKSRWRPDRILVIGTGGFYCGIPIAKILNVPYGVILARHYNENSSTIVDSITTKVDFSKFIAAFDDYMKKCRRLLVIDDLDDSGDTFHELYLLIRKRYGQKMEIRSAALWHKTSSKHTVDFMGDLIEPDAKTKKMPWIIQPHEQLIEDVRKKFNLK